jgi:hypothetical protein
MNNTFLKLAIIGGVGYLVYKYYYLPSQQGVKHDTTPNFDENDGKTTFYGNSKEDYVRGYPLPDKISDIDSDKITVIVKPNETVFDKSSKTSFEIDVAKNLNRMIYFDNSKSEPFKYMAEYDELKNKLITDKDYRK